MVLHEAWGSRADVDFWNRDRREVHGGKGVVYFELSGVVT